MWQGSMVALITPMHENGALDLSTLEDLIDWHIAEKTSALIICGTTGEAGALTTDERFALLAAAVAHAKRRIPIIAGTGTDATQTTMHLTQLAEQAGVDGCLIVTPYYNKPPQRGLLQHYKLVAEHTKLPIILYNNPGRTACDLQAATVSELSKISNIIGIKEASGDHARPQQLLELCDENFAVYSGDDSQAINCMLAGGHGVISVTANVAPAAMQAMCQAALQKDIATATKLNEPLTGLHRELFCESNPIPTKWALSEMGKIQTGLRLPLLPLHQQYIAQVKSAMQQAGVSN